MTFNWLKYKIPLSIFLLTLVRKSPKNLQIPILFFFSYFKESQKNNFFKKNDSKFVGFKNFDNQ